jgi:hypothetical protein
MQISNPVEVLKFNLRLTRGIKKEDRSLLYYIY